MPNVELWKCLPHQLPVRIAMVVQGVLRSLEMRQGRQLEPWEVWSPVLSRKIVESHRVKLFVSVTGPSWDSKSFVPGECSSRYIFDENGAWTGLLRRIPWWVSPLSRKIWGTKWPINTLATTLQTMFSLRLDFALGSNHYWVMRVMACEIGSKNLRIFWRNCAMPGFAPSFVH